MPRLSLDLATFRTELPITSDATTNLGPAALLISTSAAAKALAFNHDA
ncbi:MAG: hypothetical protein IPN81_07305 [Nitrosomonadales bacterium]|nr:hypothetical protein [Nitrosomonadales bacterium]